MSKFLSPLRVEEVEDISHDGRGTWRLIDPLVYESDVAKMTITVPAGFVTDYASVPRVPFAYWVAGDTAHPAAVVHDWLYTSHAVDRATADAVLREAADVADCIVPEVTDEDRTHNSQVRGRDAAMYYAVRAFGGSHWDLPNVPQEPHVAAQMGVGALAAA